MYGNRRTLNSRSRGLTLIELLMAISIFSLLIGVAIPNLSTFYKNSQSNDLAHTLRQHLAAARSFAITSKDAVKFCGINENNECDKYTNQNIAIFVDKNKNHTVDSDEYIYQLRHLRFKGSVRLRASFGADYVEFNKNGEARQSGSYYICHPEEVSARHRVTVSRPGRAYIAREKSADGFVIATNGTIGTCD